MANNDLISRKYVVRELLKEREHFPPMVAERYSFGVKLPNHFNQAMRGGIRKGLRIVETAPAVDVEPVQQWISVEEPPTEDGEYIVAAIACSDAIVYSWDIFSHVAGWCGEGNDFKKVLFYMPFDSLPEPPKVES